MLTRPTTEQVLVGIANELRDAVAPEVRSETLQVAVSLADIRRLCAASAPLNSRAPHMNQTQQSLLLGIKTVRAGHSLLPATHLVGCCTLVAQR